MTPRPPQIVALGGEGPSPEPDDARPHRLLLEPRLLRGRLPTVQAGGWRTRESDVRAALRGAGGSRADAAGVRGEPAARPDGALRELRAVRELRRRRR